MSIHDWLVVPGYEPNYFRIEGSNNVGLSNYGEECDGDYLADCVDLNEMYGISCSGGDIYIVYGDTESEGWVEPRNSYCWGDSACNELVDAFCHP